MIRTLDLSYNRLVKMTDADFLYTNEDTFVNLSHNSIHSISINKTPYVFSKYQPIKIDLNNNPINCDCELLTFVLFLKEQNGKTLNSFKVNVDDLKCNSPKSLHGSIVSKLSPKDLLCQFEYHTYHNPCPENCPCWRRTADKIVIVNCSNVNLTKMPMLPVMNPEYIGTELYIDNNMLTKLPKANTPGYMNVVKLHASNNRLTEVLSTNLPKNLSFLDLSKKKIQHLDTVTLSALNESQILSMALAHNPWLCKCAAHDLHLLNFVQLNFKNISDFNQLECVDGRKFKDLTSSIMCGEKRNLIIAVCVVTTMVGLFAGIVTAMYYKYQQEIKIWLYARGMCLWFVTEEELDKDKKYDAFISYSHRDEDFVTDYLLPELEKGPTPYKLCLHIRDWVVGEFIPDQIVRSVNESRRTIIVFSPNFIESVWARMEFRAAHTAALNEGRPRVILIIYGDIDSIQRMDPELDSYLQTNTYLKFGDPWFWKKLHFAMPHPSKKLRDLLRPHTRVQPTINGRSNHHLPSHGISFFINSRNLKVANHQNRTLILT